VPAGGPALRAIAAGRNRISCDPPYTLSTRPTGGPVLIHTRVNRSGSSLPHASKGGSSCHPAIIVRSVRSMTQGRIRDGETSRLHVVNLAADGDHRVAETDPLPPSTSDSVGSIINVPR